MFSVIKKRPVTCISIAALVLLLLCLLFCCLRSGVQYHDAYADAMEVDAGQASAVRLQMERANLLAVIHGTGAVLGIFLLWWVTCAFWVLMRLKAVGCSRLSMTWRAGIPLLPYVAFCWWGRVILYSRPAEYHYDAYMHCVFGAFFAVCSGCVLSALAVYYLCHRPWRKRKGA